LLYQPTDKLDIKLDYWKVDYTNLITVENSQGKLAADINGPDIVRSATGTLAGVYVDYFNSSSVDVEGIDLEVQYKMSDNLNLGVNVAHFLQYDITAPTGEVIEAAGYFNNNNFARSMPETKANVVLAWSNGEQDASLNISYISDYQHSQPVDPMGISSYTTADAQYGFRVMEDALGLSIGVKNLTDEKPPRVSDAANFSYDPKQHSPLGRVFYLKAKYSF